MTLFLSKYRLAALPVATLDRLGLVARPRLPVAYVVERANWSIRWDGVYVCREIERIAPGTAEIVDRPYLLARRIVHFFSQYQWDAWGQVLPSSNRYVVTYYHGKPEDGPDTERLVERFLKSLPRICRVVTAASLIERRLLDWGVPREKLVRIPIPINLDLFKPIDESQRRAARARFGISDDHLVIGSFQKDGVGWATGNEPKRIKGPDVFLDAVARVARERRIFVLLTGPARGYVKQGLEKLGIPHAHDYVENYEMLPRCYAALDVYLNPSSEEGGPKGVLESMASGIPVVSTRVGMAPDLITSGETGFIVDPGDAAGLAHAILAIDTDAHLRARIIINARDAVKVCETERVGRAHWDMVVRPLLAEMGR